ncbi:hypothetical protein [Arthrobacter sp. Marseille-P9274]|uniref:hypothetical protein n=1 Tax=Arthrobacter sp. Marseille-P9274 TaxID=2866572 RepID=UPI0021C78E43|nr:hypothetical protein [Arthrobacter sp. Marseille-P9274]
MTTQNRQEPSVQATEGLDQGSHATTQEPSTASAAKDGAKDVARQGTQAAKDVAGTAASEAKNLTREAGTQAKNLVSALGSNLKDQAGTQQQKVARGLWSLSDELQSMAQGAENSGPASNLVGQAAQRAGNMAVWFEARDPGSLLEEAKGFARKRPGAFLAIAAGAGLLAGRLTRGLTGSQAGTQSPAGTHVPPATPPSPAAAPSAGRTGTAASADAVDALPDPWDAEPTIAPGTPPVSTNPGGRLPLS